MAVSVGARRLGVALDPVVVGAELHRRRRLLPRLSHDRRCANPVQNKQVCPDPIQPGTVMHLALALGVALTFSHDAYGGWVPSTRVVDASVWAMVDGGRTVAWSKDGEEHHGWVRRRWEALDAAPLCGGAVVLRYSERTSTFALDVFRDDGTRTEVWSVRKRTRRDVLLAHSQDATWLVDTVAGQLQRVGCAQVTPVVALSDPEYTCSRAGLPTPCPEAETSVVSAPKRTARRGDDPSSVNLGHASDEGVWWGSRRNGVAFVHQVDPGTGHHRVVRLLHVPLGARGNPLSVAQDGTWWVELNSAGIRPLLRTYSSDGQEHYGMWSGGRLYGFVGTQLVRFDPDGLDSWCVARTWQTSERLARQTLTILSWVRESPEGVVHLGTSEVFGLMHVVQGDGGYWAPSLPPGERSKRLAWDAEPAWFQIEDTPPTPMLDHPVCAGG